MIILLASSVRTLAFIEMNHSTHPDLKSSSYVSLPFAWITFPRKRTQLQQNSSQTIIIIFVEEFRCSLLHRQKSVDTVETIKIGNAANSTFFSNQNFVGRADGSEIIEEFLKKSEAIWFTGVYQKD